MSLREKIAADLNGALKKKDAAVVASLRYLLAAVKNKEIALRGVRPLADADVVSVLRQQLKSHEESIAAYQAGSRPDLVEKETVERNLLCGYLPPSLSEEAIEKVVAETLTGLGSADFGAAMKLVLGRLGGQAEGAVVAKLVRQYLAKTAV